MNVLLLAPRLVGYLWIAFGLIWLAAALRTKTIRRRETPANRWRTVLSETIGYLVLFDSPHSGIPALAWRLPLPDAGCRIFGLIMTAGGLAIALWARATLAGNWSAQITLKENHELIQGGPYRWVRHPIYTGIIFMAVGWSAESRSAGTVGGVLILLWAYRRKWRREERLMIEHFGPQYLSYRAKTGAIIPGLG